ncbi:MAG: 3-deoxy-8-phosphooctulonate synthase [Planctomycetota bacterium]
MEVSKFQIGDIEIGPADGLFVITGPCVIESESLCLKIGRILREISDSLGIGVMFKASFDKANRSSISSYRGPGLEKGLEILSRVREETGLYIVTDVHEPWQAKKAGEVVDCLQVPAFLCRQTNLLCACAETGKAVNVKKGQFVSPAEMKNVVEKIRSCGNNRIILTERGTFFGYNRLVNDMCGIKTMQQLGTAVVFDATHSTQQPGGLGTTSAGRREMAPVLACSAVAAGANGLFLEVHPEPDEARCDSASMMPIDWLEELLRKCKKIYEVVNG